MHQPAAYIQEFLDGRNGRAVEARRVLGSEGAQTRTRQTPTMNAPAMSSPVIISMP